MDSIPIFKGAKLNTSRAIGRALQDQAITTGTNLLADAVAGNDLKQGVDREVGNIRQNAAIATQQLKNTHGGYETDEDESEIEYELYPIKKKKIITKKKS